MIMAPTESKDEVKKEAVHSSTGSPKRRVSDFDIYIVHTVTRLLIFTPLFLPVLRSFHLTGKITVLFTSINLPYYVNSVVLMKTKSV